MRVTVQPPQVSIPRAVPLLLGAFTENLSRHLGNFSWFCRKWLEEYGYSTGSL